MRASGAKYGEGSEDEFHGLLLDSLKKLEPFLGKLAIDKMKYVPPDLTNKNEPEPPAWRVGVHLSGQDKSRPWTRYVLVFNVFDGAFESEQKF